MTVIEHCGVCEVFGSILVKGLYGTPIDSHPLTLGGERLRENVYQNFFPSRNHPRKSASEIDIVPFDLLQGPHIVVLFGR